ncbi:MAG TPA: peptidylprolyl isomerase [Gammaproteobacteria bacterium]|jgi:cyclophilin family peptidyl-prolyl cis-trans isomerase
MIKAGIALLVFIVNFCFATASAAKDNPKVAIDTSYGTVVVELYPDKAPETVANFLQYVDSGFYENTIFHRVIDGFMIQGGGFSLGYQQKPVRAPIKNEANNGLSNLRGTIAMARTPQPHSATSQFFINTVDNTRLDYRFETPQGWGYCVFGKVVDGMEVVDEIAKTPTGPAGPFHSDAPQAPVVIEGVSRVTAGPKTDTAKPTPATSKGQPDDQTTD